MMRRGQRGDTIIEVIFAVTVFSLVAVGGITIMNQGAATAQRSLEISLAREQIDSQADALRYIHSAYLANRVDDDNSPWKKIIAMAYDPDTDSASIQSISNIASATSCTIGPTSGATARPFAIDASKLDGSGAATNYLLTGSDDGAYDPGAPASGKSLFGSPATYAKIVPTASGAYSDGIWIQAVKGGFPVAPATTPPGYYDFHIFACWSSPGQSVPSTLGTIVRLYNA